MKIIKENFNSIEKMLDALNSRPENSVMAGRRSSQDNDYSFSQTNSYEEAEELITNGYTEILDYIKAGIKFQATDNSKVLPTNHVFGFAPNVPNAIMNLPNSMIYSKRAPRKISSIDLIYCPTGNGHVPTSTFIENGIKILNVINSLEKNNVRIQLKIALKASQCDSEKACLVTVTVKSYREKLNLQKICFPIAHPSMLRRFGFRWLETTNEINYSGWSYGYGSSNVDYSVFKVKGIILGLNDIMDLSEEEIIQKVIKNNRKGLPR